MEEFNEQIFTKPEDSFDKPVDEGRKKSGWWKWGIFLLIVFLGFSIGLALGVYYGIVTTFNVMTDLTENTTIIVDFDESKAIDYAQAIAEEKYGETISALALGDGIEDVNLTEDEREQLVTILEEMDPSLVKQIIELDPETTELLEQAKTKPEARGLSQTLHNFRVIE